MCESPGSSGIEFLNFLWSTRITSQRRFSYWFCDPREPVSERGSNMVASWQLRNWYRIFFIIMKVNILTTLWDEKWNFFCVWNAFPDVSWRELYFLKPAVCLKNRVKRRKHYIFHDQRSCHGSRNISMDPKDFHGSKKLFMDPQKFSWIPKYFHGSPNISMDTQIFSWIPKYFHGSPNIFMDPQIFSWIHKCFHGSTKILMNL